MSVHVGRAYVPVQRQAVNRSTFPASIACQRAGISYRQFDYWIRTGAIELRMKVQGTGHHRMASELEVEKLEALGRVFMAMRAINGQRGVTTAALSEWWKLLDDDDDYIAVDYGPIRVILRDPCPRLMPDSTWGRLHQITQQQAKDKHMPFNDPGTGGDKLPLDELVGALLLIDVLEQMPEIQTAFGPATPIRADIAVLDGTHKGDTYDDALIFPRKLQGQLRGSIGAKVLGRLGKGTAKAGQSPPWELAPANDADKTIGEKYLAYTAVKAVEDEEPF